MLPVEKSYHIYFCQQKSCLAQYDCNFSMHIIPSIGNSEINLLLCTSIFVCIRFLMAFFAYSSISSPPIFGSSLITSQVSVYCENIISSDSTNLRKTSGAGADPHPFWTWWSWIYMLTPECFLLNVRIIWSDNVSMALLFMSLASVTTVIGRVWIVAQRWIWRVIFPIFTRLFLFIVFLFIWWRVW